MATPPVLRRGRRRSLNTAFLNVPYDKKYEGLYLAFIAGLCGFGLTPRATLEIPGSERRLNRILSLIRGCRYSFHDLSRVELDRSSPSTPRFNMPFEGGGKDRTWIVRENLWDLASPGVLGERCSLARRVV
jgi:hypothetical protein